MGVNEDTGAQNGIHGRVQGAGSKRRDRQRYESYRHKTLEGPVVGAVRGLGRGNVGGIVGSSVNGLWVLLAIGVSIELKAVRGRGGRIARVADVWKAAAGAVFFSNALRRACLGRIEEDLLMAGKLVASLVEKVRLEAAAQVLRSKAGRTIDAILKSTF